MDKTFALKAPNFELELSFEVYDECEYANAIVTAKVKCDGFYGVADLETDVGEINNFAASLKTLYETLGGSARLEDIYGAGFIEFTAISRGHIAVTGKLCTFCDPHSNELRFENEFDQSYLGEPIKTL